MQLTGCYSQDNYIKYQLFFRSGKMLKARLKDSDKLIAQNHKRTPQRPATHPDLRIHAEGETFRREPLHRQYVPGLESRDTVHLHYPADNIFTEHSFARDTIVATGDIYRAITLLLDRDKTMEYAYPVLPPVGMLTNEEEHITDRRLTLDMSDHHTMIAAPHHRPHTPSGCLR